MPANIRATVIDKIFGQKGILQATNDDEYERCIIDFKESIVVNQLFLKYFEVILFFITF